MIIIKSVKFDADKITFAWRDTNTCRNHRIEDEIAPSITLRDEMQKFNFVFPTNKAYTQVCGFSISYKDEVVPVKITFEAVCEGIHGEVSEKWNGKFEILDSAGDPDIINPMIESAIEQLAEMMNVIAVEQFIERSVEVQDELK